MVSWERTSVRHGAGATSGRRPDGRIAQQSCAPTTAEDGTVLLWERNSLRDGAGATSGRRPDGRIAQQSCAPTTAEDGTVLLWERNSLRDGGCHDVRPADRPLAMNWARESH
ncbi:hypothetical protein GCM10007160_37930 [Litchfieldella qijiaojingensis]|uniref:Uncharacterized protein n=1 Tax=Litchfieldella qijiaojingensis TaxID=980347 RepID=A0ABQ2Z8K6_9GAMM|nr:hypothetical protein GCM10007160_37930 [Halomonas qijiaojingensis]